MVVAATVEGVEAPSCPGDRQSPNWSREALRLVTWAVVKAAVALRVGVLTWVAVRVVNAPVDGAVEPIGAGEAQFFSKRVVASPTPPPGPMGTPFKERDWAFTFIPPSADLYLNDILVRWESIHYCVWGCGRGKCLKSVKMEESKGRGKEF
jgi:hypothetical protein